MTEGASDESELNKHLESCHECSTWLEREIAEAPPGLTPVQWQTATARCFPENRPEQALEKPAEEPKKFWSSYLHGMTYGMVFGLSIVFGLTLLSLRQGTAEETHKQQSLIYEEQGKIDEAADELKKILALIESDIIQETDPEQKRQLLTSKLAPIYHEIARLYLQNKRTSDAKVIINEGVKRFSASDPAAASKLLLHLDETQNNSDNLDKATDDHKRIIDMNQKMLD